MGTVVLMRVLEGVAAHFELEMQKSNEHADVLCPNTNLIFANHSQLALGDLGDFVGSHMVRDLRDCIVSGYFYHLWTEESWARMPSEQLDGRSYQQLLNSLDQTNGLHAEITRVEEYADVYGLRDWNFQNDRILEFKYEDLLKDEPTVFADVFRHYGFHEKAIKKSVGIASQFSFKRVTGRSIGQLGGNRHLRSGRPGQWREVLTEQHIDHVKDALGDLLIKMGYESDSDW